MVALFARAWIEIFLSFLLCSSLSVALFARAWIEIFAVHPLRTVCNVALFARAWIEMRRLPHIVAKAIRRPLCEGVD